MPAEMGGKAEGEGGGGGGDGGPLIRVIVGDELGFTKVFESKSGPDPTGEVVARWGTADRSHGVEFMSFKSRSGDGGAGALGRMPFGAIGRTDGTVDLLNLANGVTHLTIARSRAASGLSADKVTAKDRACVRGVHMFDYQNASREHLGIASCNGDGCLKVDNLLSNGGVWKVSSSVQMQTRERDDQSVLCTAMDRSERTVCVGGKLLNPALWDLETQTRKWHGRNAKPDPRTGLTILPYVNQISFLNGDERKVVIGTADHEVRLFDTVGQRRPVVVLPYGETPIKALAVEPDDNAVYVGNGSGDLVCFDMRTWRMRGGYRGHSSSIRSIVRHPTLPLIASCGLGRHLFVHNIHSRKALFKVFLKQQLTSAFFDDTFTGPLPSAGESNKMGTADNDVKTDNLEVDDMDLEGKQSQGKSRVPKKLKKRVKKGHRAAGGDVENAFALGNAENAFSNDDNSRWGDDEGDVAVQRANASDDDDSSGSDYDATARGQLLHGGMERGIRRHKRLKERKGKKVRFALDGVDSADYCKKSVSDDEVVHVVVTQATHGQGKQGKRNQRVEEPKGKEVVHFSTSQDHTSNDDDIAESNGDEEQAQQCKSVLKGGRKGKKVLHFAAGGDSDSNDDEMNGSDDEAGSAAAHRSPCRDGERAKRKRRLQNGKQKKVVRFTLDADENKRNEAGDAAAWHSPCSEGEQPRRCSPKEGKEKKAVRFALDGDDTSHAGTAEARGATDSQPVHCEGKGAKRNHKLKDRKGIKKGNRAD